MGQPVYIPEHLARIVCLEMMCVVHTTLLFMWRVVSGLLVLVILAKRTTGSTGLYGPDQGSGTLGACPTPAAGSIDLGFGLLQMVAGLVPSSKVYGELAHWNQRAGA